MYFIVIFPCLIVIYFDNIYCPLLPSFAFSKISVLFFDQSLIPFQDISSLWRLGVKGTFATLTSSMCKDRDRH